MTLLKHVAKVRVSSVDKKSIDAEFPVRLCNYTDVYYGNELRADRGDYMAATATTDQIKDFQLSPGDTVLTKDSETADDIGVCAYIAASALDFVCGYHLAILKPNPLLIVPKFLFWVTRSQAFRRQLTVAATGVTRYGLRSDALAATELSVPALPEQRRVADFLDDQVARYDQVLSLRSQSLKMREMRFDILTNQAATGSPKTGTWVKLSRLATVLPGYAFSSDRFMPEGGTPLLRGVNVSVRRVAWDDVVGWDESANPVHQRFSLRMGDIVLGMDRPWIAGGLRIARVEATDLPALLLQRVAALRPCDGLSADYLYWILQGRRFREEVEGQMTGLSVPHLSGEQIGSHRIFVPALAKQQSVAAELDVEWDGVRGFRQVCDAQSALVDERKLALITAAVTGQLDVTTARAVA